MRFPLPFSPATSRRGAVVLPPWTGRVLVGVALFLAPLVLYLRTMCPTIYPGDSAELTAAAWCLGVPHPTGYPLFMVLGYLFQHLGLGSPAFAMNAMVALFGALACVGVYRLQCDLWRHLLGHRPARSLPFRLTAGALALAMATSATWWDQATQSEVYSLMLVFVSFAWALGLRLTRRPSRRGLWVLALLSGVALLHHMLIIITFPLTALAALAYLMSVKAPAVRLHGNEGQREKAEPSPLPLSLGKGEGKNTESAENAESRIPKTNVGGALVVAVLLFLLPLAGYLYLPLRAAAQPPINWGNPQGISGILWHLTGKQYAGTRILAYPTGQKIALEEIPEHIRTRLLEIGGWMATQYAPYDANRPVRGPVLVLIIGLLALLGLVCLWRHSRLAAAGLFLGFMLNLFLVVIYTIPDIQAYQMPLWLLMGSMALIGPVMVTEFFPERQANATAAARRAHWRKRTALATVFALALAVYGVVSWYPPARGVNKSESTQAYRYAQYLMDKLPKNAVVFTFGDYDIFPLWYIQVCEGKRPDVAVIGSNFTFNPWYAAMLKTNLPAGLQVDLVNEPPSTDVRWREALMGGMIAPVVQAGRPVFLTFSDPILARYFSLRQHLVVPSPLPMAWQGGGGAVYPMPVHALSDPQGFAAEARQRFLEGFRPDQIVPVRGTGRLVRARE